jgi:hypothetical protein
LSHAAGKVNKIVATRNQLAQVGHQIVRRRKRRNRQGHRKNFAANEESGVRRDSLSEKFVGGALSVSITI